MHIVSIVDKASATADGRRSTEKRIENGHGNDDNLSVAEKRIIFEQLASAKVNSPSAKVLKTDHAQHLPPPKPVRTFAHDHYLSSKQVSIGASIAGEIPGIGDAAGPISSPKSSPKPKPPLKPKPPVVARRQHRSKPKTGADSKVQGVSHEYEHILADRSPLVLREQRLRRSLSDDPLAYAESGQLKIATFDINVEPIFYASSPVPRPPTTLDDRIYDTPASRTNGISPKPKILSKLQRRPRDSLPINRERSEPHAEEASDEIEVETDLTLSAIAVDKRVNRARLMRRRTLMHYDQQEIAFIKRQLPQLFELAALVRLEPNDGSNPMLSRDQKYAPAVAYRFPPVNENAKSDDGSIMASLSCLCYPDISKAVLTSPETYKDEQFVMTITDQFGDRKFAYCYRFVPMATVIERSNDRLSPTGRIVKIMGQNTSTFYSNEIVLNGLPQVFCVVTPVQAPNFYADFVREAAMKARRVRTELNYETDDLSELKEFLQETFWRPLPPPGGRLVVSGSWAKEVVVNHRMSSSRGIVNGLSTLVERLGVENAMLLFTALLSERRVLLVGESVPAVSKAVQAAAALLAPFEWPHTLVPVVPDPYVHLCFSPTPYLMGLLRSNLHFLKDLLVGRRVSSNGCSHNEEEDEEYILILDLDYGILKDKDFNDDVPPGSSATVVQRCLPSRTARALKQNLRSAVVSTSDCSLATPTSLVEAKDAKVADAFLVTFLDLIGHYKEFLVTQQDGHVTFQKQQFINDAATESQRSFLKWFVETGMFQVWLKKKLDSALTGGGGQGKSMTLGATAMSDAFDRRLAQMKSTRNHGGAAYHALLSAVARRWSSFLKRTK